jgi:pyrroloquinoline-quinone synthase
MPASDMTVWSRETFQTKLREVGMSRYHHLHPFHREMNEGRLSRGQIQGWAANRFYYQRNIPLKDAAILSNCPVREVRRRWLHRLTDHDGLAGDEGGIEAWLQLAEATGLTREETLVRFAVDAYVNFARQKPWPIAVASSLTELFAPDLMKERLAAFERHYPWVRAEGLRYFRSRLTLARNDSAEALALTFEHCSTAELQREAVQALAFKCDLLWAMLDATQHATFGEQT